MNHNPPPRRLTPRRQNRGARHPDFRARCSPKNISDVLWEEFWKNLEEMVKITPGWNSLYFCSQMQEKAPSFLTRTPFICHRKFYRHPPLKQTPPRYILHFSSRLHTLESRRPFPENTGGKNDIR
ncbi:hypothetical protein CEXT_506991 [Caerostris extrusa]|uniref:Uncharacterized protein n=1 Tax=Caerostris extrusa TaxID=172846 RepID=A0AAV4NL44_CAEEX|nr:hypothetical protein CEXT_506991 [Caerostris extrusa]